MPPHTAPQKVVLWIVWASLFSSVIIYRIFLGDFAEPDEIGVNALMLAMLMIPAAASAFMRWVLLPKAKNFKQVLVFAIIGMAIGESIVLFGIFLFPAQETSFFIISLLAVFQFIPTYAKSAPAENFFAR